MNLLKDDTELTLIGHTFAENKIAFINDILTHIEYYSSLRGVNNKAK